MGKAFEHLFFKKNTSLIKISQEYCNCIIKYYCQFFHSSKMPHIFIFFKILKFRKFFILENVFFLLCFKTYCVGQVKNTFLRHDCVCSWKRWAARNIVSAHKSWRWGAVVNLNFCFHIQVTSTFAMANVYSHTSICGFTEDCRRKLNTVKIQPLK